MQCTRPEYDNDPDNPDAPCRSAQESAIFAHLRRNPAARPDLVSRKSDYLGVSLPSETGSLGGRESVLGNRRSRGSRGSFDALRNPFGAEDTVDGSEEEEPEDNELEVDLASWGLDAFMPKDKSKANKGKGRQTSLPSVPPVTSVPSHHPSTNHDAHMTSPRRALGASRSMSVGGGLDYFGEDGMPPSDMRSQVPIDARRRTVSSPFDLTGMESSTVHLHRRRSETMASAPLPQTIPFPVRSDLSRSPTPVEPRLHERTYSRASLNSRVLIDAAKEEAQSGRRRLTSNASLGTMMAPNDNPFTLDPPSHISRFDPKAAAHARTISNASMGSRALLDTDHVSVMTGDAFNRERRYSTARDLLRPKVLVMPSPLQPISVNTIPPPTNIVRDGFQLSKDGPPLPPGARTSRRSSLASALNVSPAMASNPFTPNPLLDLSLSQKTFRNTLMVGGQRGSYVDIDGTLPRATEDGEQVQLEPIVVEPDIPTPALPMEESSKHTRPAGKLYGKSLIDDLENRKAQMRSKQRVFTGDQRPSMMAREQSRSSTLIDPASLVTRPLSQRLSTFVPSGSQNALTRGNSMTIKPLLTFDDDNQGLQPPVGASRIPSSRSVFGVDTLWEREMAKLREIQAQEQIDEEERRKREEEESRRKMEKKQKKGKGKMKPSPETLKELGESVTALPASEVPVAPPILPDIQRASGRSRPPVGEEDNVDDDDESDENDGLVPVRAIPQSTGWHAGSSDEEGDAGPRRTTGVGLRYPQKNQQPPPAELDSEEDVPLAATLNRVIDRVMAPPTRHIDSDDEEQPLSQLLQKTKTNLPSVDFNRLSLNPHPQADDDDDQPLGLRTSRVPSTFISGQQVDDDDKPLAWHPEQQRRKEYHIMAQQQQQQQQMMMQMQSSMFFAPSVMSSGFFPQPMINPMMMMQPPMSIPSPPPIHDNAKFGRVDRWRRDVAVEGEP
ncbi:hypothetical protein BDQ12DRAFT_675151 [Crucibulum laeve]|uniref:Uncharacterized protein n=1 Tax=Crucibulum laeve TaxID=68775 RepID=A0A5C3MGL8_9AGAR|nr:hypothetical protein BDQ12DRAFT_675151 [Crucibulum laeve]